MMKWLWSYTVYWMGWKLKREKEGEEGRKEGGNVGKERRMKREGKAVVGNFILDT